MKWNDLFNNKSKYDIDIPVVTAYDLIDNYLSRYWDEIKVKNTRSINCEIEKILGENYTGDLIWFESRQILASIRNKETCGKISYIFDCTKTNTCKCVETTNDQEYSPEIVEVVKEKILPQVSLYAAENNEFNRNYAGSHKSITALNTNVLIVLVDKQCIVFTKNTKRIEIEKDDGELTYNYFNYSDEEIEKFKDNEEDILSKLYVNIENTPLFMRRGLYKIKENKYQNNDELIPDRKTQTKIKKLFYNKK